LRIPFKKSSAVALPSQDPDARQFLIHPPLFLANLGHYRVSRIDLSKLTKNEVHKSKFLKLEFMLQQIQKFPSNLYNPAFGIFNPIFSQQFVT
jgi:hypothetical protein